MERLRTFFRRLRGMSLKRMWNHVVQIHQESGRHQLMILLDMIYCSARYGVGYLDYHVFGFAVNRGEKRRTFMTMNHNIALVRALNEREYYPLFNDKIRFNERFDQYLGRAWIDLRKSGPDGFARFIRDQQAVFVKRLDLYGGRGIERIETAGVDPVLLYNRLMEEHKYLAEEAIIQHHKLARLCPSCVNTLRITTILSGGEPHFIYAFFRTGSGKSATDNISSGGMYTAVTAEGRLSAEAFSDKTGLYYRCHPETGVAFAGFQIPFYRECIDLCLKAALVEPHMRYVGWDVAITETGPILIEGNNLPGYNMCQNYRHLDPPGIGILPKIREIVDVPF